MPWRPSECGQKINFLICNPKLRCGHNWLSKKIPVLCNLPKDRVLQSKWLIIYLVFHRQNEHCDWLIHGQVRLVKFKCILTAGLRSWEKSLFIKLLRNWTKPTGQTINQVIFQANDVCKKYLTVPTVQLKLLNFIYNKLNPALSCFWQRPQATENFTHFIHWDTIWLSAILRLAT